MELIKIFIGGKLYFIKGDLTLPFLTKKDGGYPSVELSKVRYKEDGKYSVIKGGENNFIFADNSTKVIPRSEFIYIESIIAYYQTMEDGEKGAPVWLSIAYCKRLRTYIFEKEGDVCTDSLDYLGAQCIFYRGSEKIKDLYFSTKHKDIKHIIRVIDENLNDMGKTAVLVDFFPLPIHAGIGYGGLGRGEDGKLYTIFITDGMKIFPYGELISKSNATALIEKHKNMGIAKSESIYRVALKKLDNLCNNNKEDKNV